jgi:aminoglycoside 3-N-acetyltransferase
MNVKNYIVGVRTGWIFHLFAKFPIIEVVGKICYWKLHPLLSDKVIIKLKNRSTSNDNSKEPLNFDFPMFLEFLQQIGISPGSSLVVHSSYDALKITRKLPKDIVNGLLNLIGEKGNLVMPANRVFDYTQAPVIFDVRKNRIWSGALPFALFLDKSSVKSRSPINSVVAVGPDAQFFIADELNQDGLRPCGRISAWYKMYQKNSLILGLGVDLVHNLTMTHVVEDSWFEDWPVRSWYESVKYQIIDDNLTFDVIVNQRKSQFGKYYYTESRLAFDLERLNILKSYNFNGIKVQIIRSRELVEYLRSKRPSTYPFHFLSRLHF